MGILYNKFSLATLLRCSLLHNNVKMTIFPRSKRKILYQSHYGKQNKESIVQKLTLHFSIVIIEVSKGEIDHHKQHNRFLHYFFT